MEPAEGLGKTWKIADGAFGGKFRREGFQMLRVTSQLPFVSRLAMAIMGVVLRCPFGVVVPAAACRRACLFRNNYTWQAGEVIG